MGVDKECPVKGGRVCTKEGCMMWVVAKQVVDNHQVDKGYCLIAQALYKYGGMVI